jgi:hypothetical protein
VLFAGARRPNHAEFPNWWAWTRRRPNAVAEGLNSKIQTIKKMAYGYRNREHFKTAIFFHCGGLQRMSRSLWVFGDGPIVVAGDVIVRLGCDDLVVGAVMGVCQW